MRWPGGPVRQCGDREGPFGSAVAGTAPLDSAVVEHRISGREDPFGSAVVERRSRAAMRWPSDGFDSATTEPHDHQRLPATVRKTV